MRLLHPGALGVLILLGSALMFVSQPASAIPAFARQTGIACEGCHTVPPELTPFGRRFKLGGYTLTTRQPLVNDIDDLKRNTVWLTDLPGLAILMQNTYNHYDRAPPDTGAPDPAHAASDSLQFPQQFSLAYAGAISDHVGGWLQLTYSNNSGGVGIDNTDVRYVDHTLNNDWLWGVTANNYPTFQDVWNGFGSYTIPNFNTQTLWSSPGAVAGAALRSPIINQLGPGNVAGVGAYGFYKDSLYFEFSAYHAAKSGSATATLDSANLPVGGGTVDRFAPYWRVGYEYDWGYNSAMIGTTGMVVNFIPSVGYISPTQAAQGVTAQTLNPGVDNRYTDLSVDWQYQYNGQHNIFGFMGHFIHEREKNNVNLVSATYTGLPTGSPSYSNGTDTLQSLVVTGEYFRDRRYGGIVSFQRTTGTTDVLLNGGTGSPANQYELIEADYLLYFNVRFILQYNAYQVVANNQNPFILHGSPNAKASDNNTWVLGLWMDF